MADAPEYEYMDLLADDFGDEVATYTMAAAAVQAANPALELRAGSTEAVLLEGFAAMMSLDVMALRMVDTDVVEQLAGLYGLVRDPGAAGTATVTVTVLPTVGTVTIPVGTVFQYVDEDTEEGIEFSTTEDISIIPADDPTGTVAVEVTEPGDMANGLMPGLVLMTDGEIDSLESAVLASPVLGGRDEESDAAFFGRCAALFARQTSALVTPEHFQLAALEVEGVSRAHVLDRFDPANPSTVSDGHVTVAVADQNGDPASAAVKAAVLSHLTDMAIASVTVHVIDPAYFTPTIDVAVITQPGYDTVAVHDAVQAALAAWLSPASWPWSGEVTPYAVAGMVMGTVTTVQAVASVTVTGGTSSAPAPLTRYVEDQVTVEVTAG